MVIYTDDATFEQEVRQYAGPLMVEFYASWCPHCQKMKPVVSQVSKLFAGKVKVCSVDVDLSPVSSAAYGVSSIPVFVFIKNGETLAKISGEQSVESLQKQLEALL